MTQAYPAAATISRALSLAGVITLAGCHAAPWDAAAPGALDDAVADPAPAGAAARLEPFEQTVPGTAISFAMVPVPVSDDDGPAPGFWIASTEVTWELFDAFLFKLDGGATGVTDAITRPSKPYISMDRGFGHAGYPVISVSYHSAQTFCRWLSAKTGRTYRLPTRAEWERACRLGEIDAERVDAHAWTRANADHRTHKVGTRAPDALGVHDLWGNASEWCTGADGSPVTMGGSFRSRPNATGCGAAEASSPEWNDSDPQIPKSIWWLADGGFVGFRVVCVPDATTTNPGGHP